MAEPIHDFTSKLHDRTVLPAVLEAMAAQSTGRPASSGPISINLDLTRSCNYGCDHCIDASILNQGKPFDTQVVKDSLDVLSEDGLRTVIFIGGGEPTLHPAFADAVAHAKQVDLSVGIVSNGSRNRLLADVAPLLDGVDWIRLSLDAGTDRSFQLMHRPRRPIRLEEICEGVKAITDANPAVGVGFSFIISWVDPLRIDGAFQHDNVDEIEAATILARDSGFSYISFKPLLHRDPGGNESIRFPAGARGIELRNRIRSELSAAQSLASDEFAVVGSVNLAAIEQEGALREQPHRCYMHLFRQVLTPEGLYGCPAYRGDARDRLGGGDSYATSDALTATKERTVRHMETFDPSIECRTISCLYSSANLWLDRIASGETAPAPADSRDLFL